jgi:hypothetical protein
MLEDFSSKGVEKLLGGISIESPGIPRSLLGG